MIRKTFVFLFDIYCSLSFSLKTIGQLFVKDVCFYVGGWLMIFSQFIENFIFVWISADKWKEHLEILKPSDVFLGTHSHRYSYDTLVVKRGFCALYKTVCEGKYNFIITFSVSNIRRILPVQCNTSIVSKYRWYNKLLNIGSVNVKL